MAKQKKLSRRFEELALQLQTLENSKRRQVSEMTSGDYIDNNLFINWKLKVRNLLSLACGESSLHFRDFVDRESGTMYSTNYETMKNLAAVFEAAQEDYEEGYCAEIRTLIQSELFDSELDQARALLDGGYLSAAAVVAGVVLETTLRQLCDNHKLVYGKLDKMNADLARIGQYTVLRLRTR